MILLIKRMGSAPYWVKHFILFYPFILFLIFLINRFFSVNSVGDGLSNKAELAVVLSLSVGLVLLLIMLIAVLCCRRQNLKKNQEQQTKTTTQSTSSGTQQVEPSNNDSEQPGSKLRIFHLKFSLVVCSWIHNHTPPLNLE